MASSEHDDKSSQNPPGRRRLSPNSRNRAIELFTSALARFGLGRDTTPAADEHEDQGQGQSEEEDGSEISSTTDASEKPEADGPRVQTEGEEEIELPSSNAEEERRPQHPENTLCVDDHRSPSIEVKGEQTVRQPRSPDIVVKQEPVSPTAEIDPITGRAVAVVDLTGDDDNNANPEIRRTSQAVHDPQPSNCRPIKRRRTSPPPSSIPTSRRRRRRERTHEPTPDLSYMPDAEQEDLDESPSVDLYDIPVYPGSPVENAEAGAEETSRQNVVGQAPSQPGGNPVEITDPGPVTQPLAGASQGSWVPGRSRSRKRKAPAEPTRRSRRIRGEPPECGTFEGIKGKRL
ncbi:hypothetical protein VTN00DRAFT_1009 [Thermoascus crustaceus]|uniref:uncharacterized protein n=1 Tax=Thermoascus crustaceus TaxID=5088 RepID=UPI0037425F89